MRKNTKKDMKSCMRVALAFAFIFGLSACGDAEWEKQGYENEEIFEQALTGGFQDRLTFEAAQKYSVTSKSDWDALNQKVIDGEFASIEVMREAAELGYSTQAAWDAVLVQQAEEAGFSSVAWMRKAQDQGYATQAEWDSAIERKRIEGIMRDGASSLANVVACGEMNTALTSGDIGAIISAVGKSGLDRIFDFYTVLEMHAEYVAGIATESLPEDAKEEFGVLWRDEYKTLTAGFWDLDTTSKLTAYDSQCSMRTQMICTRNNMRSPPDYVLQAQCKRAGIR